MIQLLLGRSLTSFYQRNWTRSPLSHRICITGKLSAVGHVLPPSSGPLPAVYRVLVIIKSCGYNNQGFKICLCPMCNCVLLLLLLQKTESRGCRYNVCIYAIVPKKPVIYQFPQTCRTSELSSGKILTIADVTTLNTRQLDTGHH